MSPILVRPVREQLEHDRLIRLLQTKFRRKYEAGINPGDEQNAPVGTGPYRPVSRSGAVSQDRGHQLQAMVEVETGESVNHLEALAQWAHFAKLRAAFHLYVPANMVDVARRLCEDNQIHVAEIWSYHIVGDQLRFTLVHRSREAAPPRSRRACRPRRQPSTAAKPAAKAAPGDEAKQRRASSPRKPRNRRRRPRKRSQRGEGQKTAKADS